MLERKKERGEEKRGRKRPEKVARKWKGKDWYVILAPKAFGGNTIAETPTLDPKSLIGRIVDVNLADLTGKSSKFYINMRFRINGIEDKNALTLFNGYYCLREHLFRAVRKRSQKVRTINNVETKDNWLLQVTTLIILNRNTDVTVQKKERKLIRDHLEDFARKSSLEDFVKATINGIIQKHIRKTGSKIYPVRFSEIESIEVLKTGLLDSKAKMAKPADTGPLDKIEKSGRASSAPAG
jgi:ribosomal protein S3AE